LDAKTKQKEQHKMLNNLGLAWNNVMLAFFGKFSNLQCHLNDDQQTFQCLNLELWFSLARFLQVAAQQHCSSQKKVCPWPKEGGHDVTS